MVTKIEGSLHNGQFTLGTFLDIEGAFDNATYQSIKEALEAHKIDEAIQGWLINMLINRKENIEIKEENIIKNLTKGVPQGGILSPTLWNFILETLLDVFTCSHIFLQGYTDDVTLILCGDNPNILANFMNNAQ